MLTYSRPQRFDERGARFTDPAGVQRTPQIGQELRSIVPNMAAQTLKSVPNRRLFTVFQLCDTLYRENFLYLVICGFKTQL